MDLHQRLFFSPHLRINVDKRYCFIINRTVNSSVLVKIFEGWDSSNKVKFAFVNFWIFVQLLCDPNFDKTIQDEISSFFARSGNSRYINSKANCSVWIYCQNYHRDNNPKKSTRNAYKSLVSYHLHGSLSSYKSVVCKRNWNRISEQPCAHDGGSRPPVDADSITLPRCLTTARQQHQPYLTRIACLIYTAWVIFIYTCGRIRTDRHNLSKKRLPP